MLKRIIGLVLLIAALVSPAFAQDDDPVEFVDRFEQRYKMQDPKIGTAIETIKAYDEQGQPFDNARVKGKYAVYVFGCLT